MKKAFYLTLAFFLAGCCTVPEDISLERAGNSEEGLQFKPITIVSPDYPDHFLACRADSENEREREIVKNILKEIESANTDVVLYFHGGLSSQQYMVNKLGKWLMDKVFEQATVKQTVYPVFMNYDADPRDWDLLTLERENLVNNSTYTQLVELIEAQLKVDAGLSATEQRTQQSVRAAKLIYTYGGKPASRFKYGDTLTDEDIAYFYSLLEAKTLPAEFSKDKETTAPLYELAELVATLQAEHTPVYETEQGAAYKSLLAPGETTLRVLRILARYALKTDHGQVATIQEELLDALGVGWLGKTHWDKVKRHAKQCFAKNSNGRMLVEGLRDLKQKYPERQYRINTLSHSAGSYPTAELIHYLAGTGAENAVLNQVVMLAPAVNQQVFSELVVPNHRLINQLTVYSLTKDFELEDTVIAGLLYSSSLLYAVSSLGEGRPSMDKMLLIAQHMDSTQRPYNSSVYQLLAHEKPKKVWDYFATAANTAFVYYPAENDNVHNNKGPTHEGTKFPWESTDLTRKYLGLYEVPYADKLIFVSP